MAGDVIVVGNGASIVASGLGLRIDSFTHVFRINDFKLEPADTGSKTTGHCRAAGMPSPQPELSAPAKRFVVARPHGADLKARSDEVVLCDAEICRVLGVDGKNAWATTGLCLIHALLQLHASVSLVGFAGPVDKPHRAGKVNLTCYKNGTWSSHDQVKERAFLLEQARQSRLCLLDEELLRLL